MIGNDDGSVSSGKLTANGATVGMPAGAAMGTIFSATELRLPTKATSLSVTALRPHSSALFGSAAAWHSTISMGWPSTPPALLTAFAAAPAPSTTKLWSLPRPPMSLTWTSLIGLPVAPLPDLADAAVAPVSARAPASTVASAIREQLEIFMVPPGRILIY